MGNGLFVPGRIVIAVVAKLTLYGFRGGEGVITEFLRILEKDGAAHWCCQISATNLAIRRGESRRSRSEWFVAKLARLIWLCGVGSIPRMGRIPVRANT